MIKKQCKLPILFALPAVLLLLFCVKTGCWALEGNVEYSGNTGDFIFEPGGDSSPTDLFAGFKQIMPGAVSTQRIKVKSNADEHVKVKFYIRSLGADAASKEFLKQLHLTVTCVAGETLFDSSADEAAGLTEWTEIGILKAGGEAELELTLSVPTSLDNRYQKATGTIKWQFLAIELPADEKPWVCPGCGQSHYHIVDGNEYCEYECEICGTRAEVLCLICGGRMHKHIEKDAERKLWYSYVCENSDSHRTEPLPPTGSNDHTLLWGALAACSATATVILWRKRKMSNKEAC